MMEAGVEPPSMSSLPTPSVPAARRLPAAGISILAAAAVIALLYFGRVFFITVLIAVIIAFLVELARGHSGAPYGWLAAVGGVTYIAAVIVFRIRG